jgi:hypothetical protein
MSSVQGRWVFFLSGVVCAVWLLAIAAFLSHLVDHWPSDPVAEQAEASDRDFSKIGRTWKLRTQPTLPPVSATTLPLHDGRWGLLLCGVHEDDTLFEMGFRDGDVLIEVDGWRASTPRAALASFGRILAEEVRCVGVSRGSDIVSLRRGNDADHARNRAHHAIACMESSG